MTNENDTPETTEAQCGENWLSDLSMFKARNVDVSRAMVKTVFETHNFGAAVREPRAETILKRATREGRKPKNYVVREFARPDTKSAAMSFGIYVVNPVTGEIGDEHTCVARVRLEKQYNAQAQQDELIAVARPPEGKAECEDRTAWKRATEIADHANHLLLYVQNTDLGNAIRDAAKNKGAAKVLGGGNNYIVPKGIAQDWYKFLKDLESIGVWTSRIPLLRSSPAAVTMVSESAKASLEADLKDLKKRLQEAVKKQDSERSRKGSLTKQIQYAETLRAKGGLYVSLLGDQISELNDLINNMNKHFETLLDGGKLAENVVDEFKDFLGEAPMDVESESETSEQPASEEKEVNSDEW